MGKPLKCSVLVALALGVLVGTLVAIRGYSVAAMPEFPSGGPSAFAIAISLFFHAAIPAAAVCWTLSYGAVAMWRALKNGGVPSPGEDTETRKKLRVIGVLFIVLGGIGMGAHALVIFWAVSRFTVGVMQAGGGLEVWIGSAGLILSTVVVIGGNRLRKSMDRGWAVAAIILAMVPGLSPLFLLALPVSIYALVLVHAPEGREALVS